MATKNKTSLLGGIIGILVLLLISACGNSASTATPTPTILVIEEPVATTPPHSLCEGLAGELEIQVLVGPADAVDLTPVAVGSIPFTVTTNEEPYPIEGNGGFEFADILVEEWGTYEVTMAMNGIIVGTCVANDKEGELIISLELTGSQLVVVIADGFSHTYPWEGTLPFDYSFPLEEGASLEGEGYSIVLHLK